DAVDPEHMEVEAAVGAARPLLDEDVPAGHAPEGLTPEAVEREAMALEDDVLPARRLPRHEGLGPVGARHPDQGDPRERETIPLGVAPELRERGIPFGPSAVLLPRCWAGRPRRRGPQA